MSPPEGTIRVPVEPSNPGQFFACCGLLELADRLRPGAEGWFGDGDFRIAAGCGLADLLAAARAARYVLPPSGRDDEDYSDEDRPVTPLVVDAPLGLRLDWWGEDRGLKTWAGSMKVELIAAAMSYAIDPARGDPFDQAAVVFDPPMDPRPGIKPAKPTKREPFYFDSRRASNAHALDLGFSANDLELTTLAYPAVEFLCLVGLGRVRPRPVGPPRTFDYWTWTWPIPVPALPVAVAGVLGDPTAVRFRFENAFRSGQRKHKAFGPAARILSEARR